MKKFLILSSVLLFFVAACGYKTVAPKKIEPKGALHDQAGSEAAISAKNIQNQDNEDEEDRFITYEEIDRWKVYKNSKYGFEIQFPDTYIVNEQDPISPALESEDGRITFWVDNKSKALAGRKVNLKGAIGHESPLIGNINGSAKYELIVKNYDKKGHNFHALFVTKSGSGQNIVESRIILSTLKFIRAK